MALKRIAVCLLFASLSILPSWAQYNATITSSMTDLTSSTCNTSNCFVTTNAINTGGTLAFFGGWGMGADGYMATSQSTTDYYEMQLPTQGQQPKWKSVSGLALSGGLYFGAIAPQDSTNVFALISDSTCQANGYSYYTVYKANSAKTAWSLISPDVCLDTLHTAHDGTLVGAVIYGSWKNYASFLLPGASSWTLLTGANIWSEVVPVNQTTGYGIMTNQSIAKINFTNNTYTVIQTNAAIPGAGNIAAGADGSLFVVGTTTPTTVWYQDTIKAPGTFRQLGASANMKGLIAANKAMMFGLAYVTHACPNGLTGACVPSHWNSYVPYTSGSLAGSYTTYCNNHPNTCQPGYTHTITYNITYPNGSGSGQAQASGSPTSYLNGPAYGFADPASCDMFAGIPSITCIPSQTNGAQCDGMGPLTSNPAPSDPCTELIPANDYSSDNKMFPGIAFDSGATVDLYVDTSGRITSAQASDICLGFAAWSSGTGVHFGVCNKVTTEPIDSSGEKLIWVTDKGVPSRNVGAAVGSGFYPAPGIYGCWTCSAGDVHSSYSGTHLYHQTVFFYPANPFNGGALNDLNFQSIATHEMGHMVGLGEVLPSDPVYHCPVVVNPNPSTAYTMMMQDTSTQACHLQSNPPTDVTNCDLKWWGHWAHIYNND